MFEHRSLEAELMDSPAFDPVLSAQSFRFIEWVNRYLGGERLVRAFVFTAAEGLGRPLRVLDIGAGSCDIPIAIARRARARRIPVEFTCVESSPHAVARAEMHLRRASDLPVRIVSEDIFEHAPAAPYDLAVGSMFFHHLDDARILKLLEHLRSRVSGPVLINDLERGALNYYGATFLTRPLARGVRHDALLSVRRGFRAAELVSLCSTLPEVRIEVTRRFPGRIAALLRYTGRSPSGGRRG